MLKIVLLTYKFATLSIRRFNNWLYSKLFHLLLKIHNVNYGINIRCNNSVPRLQISKDSKSILLGNNLLFNSFTDQSWNCPCKLLVLPNAELVIGSNSGLNGVMVYCSNSIHIGEYVNIGGGTRIFDSNHHSLDWCERRDPVLNHNAKSAPIEIENDVFIGANCIIQKGVTIGARSIVAAGSVVIKSIPSDEIWGGNPACFIKKI